MSLSMEQPVSKVGIVILNYRNFVDTVACLQSLAYATYPRVETIVVDNDSRNNSLQRIGQDLESRGIPCARLDEGEVGECFHFQESVFLVQASANRGYAAGNNLGIRAALARGCDYVLILNNDTEVQSDFLEPLVVYAEAHPELGAVGPKILNVEGGVEPTCARRRPELLLYFFGAGIGKRMWPNNPWRRRHFYQGEYSYDCPKEVDVLSGSCMLIKRAVFEQVGLLDENTFLFQEELILHEKMRGAGWRQAIVPDSVIVHKGGQSTHRELPAHIRKASRESLRYYLKAYRHVGWLTRVVIDWLVGGPPGFLRRARNPRKDIDN